MKQNGFTLMARLWKMVRPVRKTMMLCILGGVVGNLSILVTLTAGAAFLCTIAGQSVWFSRSTWLTILLVSAALRGPCRYLEQYKGHDVAYTLLAYMRVDIYNKIRELSPAKLTEKRSGDILSIAIGDVECIEAFFAHTIAPIVIAVVTVVVSMTFCMSIWAPLGAVLLPLYCLVGLVVPILSARLGKERGRQYRAGLGELKSYLLDSLRGIKEILSYGQGRSRTENLDVLGRKMNRLQHGLILQKNIVQALPDFVTMISRILMMWICSVKMLQGVLTIGQTAMLMVAVGASFSPVSALSSVSGSLIQTFAAAERVFRIYDEQPQVTSPDDPETIPADAAEVDFENVWFRYPETEEGILEDLSLHIPVGGRVGFWGQSGCGKTTILRLLMRFWDPDKGTISLGGTPLPRLDLEEERQHISMLSQETWLSSDSIADNIRLGKLGATLEEIRAAADKACIDQRIMELPLGYDTPAGELGERLSGGERQRIGIARVLLRNSPVLLMDEPTSSLDTLNEKGILKTLNETVGGNTIITVSHRRSTIAGADRIYRIEKGKAKQIYERKEVT